LAPGYTGSGKNAMETLTYGYNIRSWLTGINSAYALDQNTGDQFNDFFGLYLGYDNRDNQFAAARLDGKITGALWKSQGDNSMRKYDYTYDDLGRMTSGLFNQRMTPADNWSNSSVDLSEYIGYADANGNIRSMKHMGIVPGITGGLVVDNLTYSYGSAADPNVNQLSRVDEGANFTGNGQLDDFKDGTNPAGSNDYIYDNNGNLVQDQNKGITDGGAGGVVYNYLNKPVAITIAGKSLIQYTYDANGNKLTKTVTNLALSPNTSTTTTYDDQFVYQDNILQYILHEEGRMRLITPVNTAQIQLNAGSNPATVLSGQQGVFEYFIKDQLSNIRMVLTEEVQTEFYIATMETSSASDPNLGTDEAKLFGQVDPTTGNPTANNEVNLTRTSTPASLWTSNTSAEVADLTAAGTNGNQTIGPNMLLQVSAGDMINAGAAYYYYTNGTTSSSNGVTDALTALMGALLTANAPAIAEINSGLINSSLGSTTSNFSTFINANNPTGSVQAPNAYLNILFFDEQFNFIVPDPNNTSLGSRSIQVSAANAQNVSLMLQQKAPKNGYVYIYLSNESNEDVYFDNFSVSQVHSPIVEEDHYYAFGQKIAGICTLAFNKPESKYHYQASFSEEEENTGWNEFALRMYDPQLGRWTGVDPYDQFASPYVGMGNDPMNHVDPSGGDIGDDLDDLDDLDFSSGPGGPPVVSIQSIRNITACSQCEILANAQTFDAAVVTAKVPLFHLVESEVKQTVQFYAGILSGIGKISVDLIKLSPPVMMMTAEEEIVRDGPSEYLEHHSLFSSLNVINGVANGLAMLLDPTGQKQKAYFGKLYFDFKYSTPFDQGNTVAHVGVAVASIAVGQPEVGLEEGAIEGGAALAENPEALESVTNMATSEPNATLYRNFGWNELNSIKESGGDFSIHPGQFQSKQFWVGESGLDMWTKSTFAKPFTAKISIPESFVTPGSVNYIFLEPDMTVDGFPGGTVLPQNLQLFNSVKTIQWIRY
jgi:RHS repeat-associated protein